MAVSATATVHNVPAGVRFAKVRVTPDSSYPTGGELLTPAQAGFASSILWAEGISDGGIVWKYLPATGKIKAFWVDTTTDGAALAEVVNTTDLSTTGVVDLLAIGF